MRLSEAILLGSTLSPQCIGEYESNDGSRCALGAALAAVGEEMFSEKSPGASLSRLWPHLDYEFWGAMEHEYACPENWCGAVAITLGGAIVHLNDGHHWTRERIAKWVRMVEPKESPSLDIANPVSSAIAGDPVLFASVVPEGCV